MKKLLLIQPARLGDIFICLPVAKHYHDLGYDVHWPVMEEFLSTFNRINYVSTIKLEKSKWDFHNCVYGAYACNDGSYDKVIDLSFGFHGSKSLQWEYNTIMASNFVDAKYKIAKLNIHNRHPISFDRDRQKEDELYSLVVKEEPYVLVHNSTSGGELPFDLEPEDLKTHQVFVRPIQEYNMFDWYKVIAKAQRVYCVNSSFFNMIEGVDDFHEIPKTYVPVRNGVGSWNERRLTNNWNIRQ